MDVVLVDFVSRGNKNLWSKSWSKSHYCSMILKDALQAIHVLANTQCIIFVVSSCHLEITPQAAWRYVTCILGREGTGAEKPNSPKLKSKWFPWQHYQWCGNLSSCVQAGMITLCTRPGESFFPKCLLVCPHQPQEPLSSLKSMAERAAMSSGIEGDVTSLHLTSGKTHTHLDKKRWRVTIEQKWKSCILMEQNVISPPTLSRLWTKPVDDIIIPDSTPLFFLSISKTRIPLIVTSPHSFLFRNIPQQHYGPFRPPIRTSALAVRSQHPPIVGGVSAGAGSPVQRPGLPTGHAGAGVDAYATPIRLRENQVQWNFYHPPFLQSEKASLYTTHYRQLHKQTTV